MSIKTGAQYLASIQDDREVWLRGERVKDVTQAPGIQRGAATLASFLDRQVEPEFQDKLTYVDDGERYSMSFLTPHSTEDVQRRGAAYYQWAKWSNGMFGRTPDYKNASVMAFAAAADFLNQNHSSSAPTNYADNMRNYYNEARQNDYILTHTLVNPQVNAQLAKEGLSSPEVALQVVGENADGIIVWCAFTGHLGPQRQ
ncbi:MAG: hypothetical protein GXP16_06715 [Gammaproteobacteria bacterium]|nr:hypothetical protein [Gammaproteobacteria bacterium]